jgi:phospholipid/cholesterol/gamma-HCH transport system permease protein
MAERARRTTLGRVPLLGALIDFGRFVDFAMRSIAALPRALFQRPGEVLRQFERVAIGGLPLTLVAGLSLGMVTWMQTRRLLAQYDLESTLPSLLTVAVFVETGPILAALLVAGRMGAGLAAEFASMALTEELDAREVLGAPPIPTLVAPRAIACAAAVPLLTVWIDAAAFAGGLFAEVTAGTLTVELFAQRSLDFLRLVDIVPATLKTAAFGLLIALVGCWTGWEAERSTEAVGRAATWGVVRAMLAVFAADVAIVPWLPVLVDGLGWNG